MKLLKGIGIAVGVCVAAEAAVTAYFYKRTMRRNKGTANNKRTIKMAGTDWDLYMPLIQQRKERMLAESHEDVYEMSHDGLKLHATWFPQGDQKKVVICFHGYTSQGMSDYIGLSDYYMKRGFSMLLPDARAHGESEGKKIGFGCLDRHDAMMWIRWVIDRCGEDVKIILHGTSMGAATVLMTAALDPPEQVMGLVSDCAFTSPKHVFTHVLHSMYHMPTFPIIQLSDLLNRLLSGYGLDECNAAREVQKTCLPGLLIHGSKDNFVPCSMCDEIYENYAGPKRKLIVKGAAHAESYYKNMSQYEDALDEWMEDLA